jgi:hypothetical protein
MAGKSTTSEMFSLRVPHVVMLLAKVAAKADGTTLAVWIVDAMARKLTSLTAPPLLVKGATLEARPILSGFALPTSPGSRRADAPATATIKDGLVTAGKTAHRWTDGARCRQCGAMMRTGKCALGCK